MKIGIVGMGLMGGSFGRALVKKGYTVYGFDLSDEVMLKCELLHAFTAPLTKDNAGEVDLLIAAVNPSKFEKAIAPFLPLLKRGATVSDFCGVKRVIVKTMRELSNRFTDLNFIGAHPMAGREYSGIEHSSITLFEKASMILVPVKADIFIIDAVKEFYLSVGFSRVVITDAEFHDEVIAYTSQLCHIVSNAFILNNQAENRLGYSAGSFRDLTRVARMNPELWTELIAFNCDNALKELDELLGNLKKYRNAIAEKDYATLSRLFSKGNDRKIRIEQGRNDNV